MSVRVAFGSRSSRIGMALSVVALVALAAAPFWGGRGDLQLLSQMYTYIALASLWNLLAGYAGLVSVGVAGLCRSRRLSSVRVRYPRRRVAAVGHTACGHHRRHHRHSGRGSRLSLARPLFRDRHVDHRRSLSPARVASFGAGRRFRHQLAGFAGHLDRVPVADAREFVVYWIALALVVAVLALIVLLLRSRYGLALKAIRDSELAATCNGIDVLRTKVLVYILTAFGTAMIGALIFFQRLRISPDAAFSVNDWTAFVIFITVIGGIGRIEGPIIGTIVFFALRQTLADLGTIYLLMLGVVAILVMLATPKGLWGLIVERFGWQIFPLERTVVLDDRGVQRGKQRPDGQ